ncbi:MAG: potassium channel family protein [Psychromonas sp.]
MQRSSKRKKITEKDNFSYLLFSLIFLLFSSAAIDHLLVRSFTGQSLIIALTILSMCIAVWSMRSSAFAFSTGISIVISTLVIATIVIVLDRADLEFIHLILMIVFFLATLKPACQQALFSGTITANNIIGSICIFLLLGLIWALLYLLLLEFSPSSFSGLDGVSWKENLPDTIYFSFVTLTTLGFGEILPTAPIARFLVYMEAIVGVFYMAIVVSSLVGAGINDSHHTKV